MAWGIKTAKEWNKTHGYWWKPKTYTWTKAQISKHQYEELELTLTIPPTLPEERNSPSSLKAKLNPKYIFSPLFNEYKKILMDHIINYKCNSRMLIYPQA